jgi:hypothetical protein
MIRRILFILTAGFWIVMNTLLWRSEMSPAAHAASRVPPHVVFHKMLTAPDTSSFEILHRGKEIGTCRWAPNVGEEQATGATASEDVLPEGMVHRLTGYTIDLDGNAMVEDPKVNAFFSLRAAMDTNRVWKSFSFRLNIRPTSIHITGDAAADKVSFALDSGNEHWERTFTLAELSDPMKTVQALNWPEGGGWLDALGLGASSTDARAVQQPGLEWDARYDTLNIGQTPVRVYRLRARLGGLYEAVLHVGRAGEILRAELPDGIVLLNYAFAFH